MRAVLDGRAREGRPMGSYLEAAFKALLTRYDLPLPERQYEVRARDGSRMFLDWASLCYSARHENEETAPCRRNGNRRRLP